jgi:hypothetical protein
MMEVAAIYVPDLFQNDAKSGNLGTGGDDMPK